MLRAQVAARDNRINFVFRPSLAPDFRVGSKAAFVQSAGYFRSTPINRHSQGLSVCLKRAKKRHAQRFAPNFPHGLTRWKFLDRNSGAELLIVHRPGGPTPIGKPSL